MVGIRASAEVAELADALDSKSSEVHTSCGFDPRLRHHDPVPRVLGAGPRCVRGEEGVPPYLSNHQTDTANDGVLSR
jgi:hypothetical protein